jgi:hypothetical protein
MRRVIVIVASWVVVASVCHCSLVEHPLLGGLFTMFKDPLYGEAEYRQRVSALQAQLLKLNGGPACAADAAILADVAILHTQSLAVKYELVRPSVLHNVMVNLGYRPRGVCHHWAEDLLRALRSHPTTCFDLYWGLANPRNPLTIHSSVVVTARGKPFADGLILDGWRHSGRLFWIPVRQDRFKWRQKREDVRPEPGNYPGAGIRW